MKKLTCAGLILGVAAFLGESGFAVPVVFDIPTGTTFTFTPQITNPAGIIVNTDGLTQGTLVLTGNGPGTGAGIGNNYTGATLVEGGILQAGAASGDGNAFSPNSDFTLSGTSTLDLNGNTETIASLAGSSATIVTNSGNGPGTLIVDDTNSQMAGPVTTTFDGIITDAGTGNFLTLDKEGTGTLILTNANTYSGSTIIGGGTLQAGVESGANTAFSATSDFDLTGTGTLDLNGNDETIASLTGSSTSTVTNSGNGPAVLVINDANSQLAGPVVSNFGGVITDGGVGDSLRLVKQGGGTLVLTNDNTYGGGTLISGGTLAVGNLTGAHDNTSLALGNGNVVNDAKLETTASLGFGAERVIVNGGYAQTADGTLLLQVVGSPETIPALDSGVAGLAYDTLDVVDDATLSGALGLNFQSPTIPSQGQRYVVVTAGAPLTTEFDVTNTNLTGPYFTVTTYNDTFGGSEPADSVIVTLIKPFTDFAGLTANQVSVARDIDGNLGVLNRDGLLAMPTGAVADFFNNIVTGLDISSYSSGALGASLDQLSPQRLEILHNIAFDNYALDVQSLDDEFARERLGHGGIDTSGFAINNGALGSQLSQIKGHLLAWSPATDSHGMLSDSTPAVLGGVKMTDSKDMKDMKEMTPEAVLNKWNGFIDGGVDLGDLEHNVDVGHSSYTTGRVRGGVDYLVARNFRVGALFGYSHTDADLDNEGSKAHIDSYTPGLYATYADPKGFYANGLFTYTRNDYSTDRDVVIPGVNRTAGGSPSGDQFGVNLDGGYEFHKGNWTFGPSAGLTYVNLGIDSFQESGAGAADLNVDRQSVESFRSRLGGTVSYETKFCSLLVRPHLSAFWQHEFLDGNSLITSEFEGLPGGTFSVQTTDGDSDNALLGFGIDAYVTQNLTVFVDYQTEAGGSSFFGQSATGGVKVGF